jgi:hypothetical protein
VAQETLAAQRQGWGDCVRLPATVDELRAHLDDEVTVSLRVLVMRLVLTAIGASARQAGICC